MAFADTHPLTPGHTLVVPARHVPSLLLLSDDELRDLWLLALRVCRDMREEEPYLDFNLGVNEGPAAGQTIEHVHLHVIPRRSGDMRDPRGGIRWILPEKAPYWEDD